MKDFSRNDLSLSLCGLNCKLCPMQLGGYCPGCGGGAGNQPCAIARCSLQHDHVQYCFLCSEYPCSNYAGAEDYDSFITHQHQLGDIQRASEIGIDAYNQEQQRKFEILQSLLAEFNDGRKKTFYCVAVNLLPLGQLEGIMKQITNNPSLKALPLKDQVAKVVALFEEEASREGLVLKLRKKASL